ncbi:MAG: response regulator, partial [Candidatus Sulfotelmatobacter sp.]
SGVAEHRGGASAIHLVKPLENGSEPIEDAATLQAILLVEDEPFVQEVMREVLRAAGYSVVGVRTAVEAARVYEEVEGAVDLLLTDVILPGETGPELAAKLRLTNPGLRVLYVTGYATQMKACEQRGETFLAKPFSSERLLCAVRQALSANKTAGSGYSGMPAAESCLHHLGGNI